MSKPRCPKCGRVFDPAGSKAFPFCSERCQMIDLGSWLDEDYGLPEDIEGAIEDLAGEGHSEDDPDGDPDGPPPNRNGWGD